MSNHKSEDEGRVDSEGDDPLELSPPSTDLTLVEGTELSPAENQEDAQSLPIPALQRMRSIRHYGRFALGVGVIARALVTLCTTIEDAASIGDLFLTYTRFYLVFIIILVVFFCMGTGEVTWSFWTPLVQHYAAVCVDWFRRCLGGRIIQIPGAEQSNDPPAGLNRVRTSVPYLSYVSVSCSMANLALVANENEEGTRMMLGLPRPTIFTASFSLGLGAIATAYSAVTDLRSLWPSVQDNNSLSRRPSAFIYTITFLGTLELFYRTWILIYLTSLEQWSNRGAGFFFATLFTLCGTYVNFCFQTSYALEGSPFLLRVKAAMINLALPIKIIFLAVIGVTTVVSNMSMSTFNLSTLLPSIFNDHFGYSIAPSVFNLVAVLTAAGITFGDVMSSYIEVIRQMMGYDQPDNLFLRGVRSEPVSMGRPYWMNSNRISVLPDDYEDNLQDAILLEDLNADMQQGPGPNVDYDFD